MQYKVPQDVQREDTIIGPLTMKQMIILGAGGGIAYAIYVSLAKTYYAEVWLPPVAIVVVITLAFAFIKINGLPFSRFIMNFIEYRMLPRKRIWVQGAGTPFVSYYDQMQKEETAKNSKIVPEAKTQKSIKEITAIVDSYGESVLSKEEKKEGLEKIVNENYK